MPILVNTGKPVLNSRHIVISGRFLSLYVTTGMLVLFRRRAAQVELYEQYTTGKKQTWTTRTETHGKNPAGTFK
jgi:hypothetical protein